MSLFAWTLIGHADNVHFCLLLNASRCFWQEAVVLFCLTTARRNPCAGAAGSVSLQCIGADRFLAESAELPLISPLSEARGASATAWQRSVAASVVRLLLCRFAAWRPSVLLWLCDPRSGFKLRLLNTQLQCRGM